MPKGLSGKFKFGRWLPTDSIDVQDRTLVSRLVRSADLVEVKEVCYGAGIDLFRGRTVVSYRLRIRRGHRVVKAKVAVLDGPSRFNGMSREATLWDRWGRELATTDVDPTL